MTTFLWYDYETFGLNKQKDRPSQFAAIRTDENLNILGEPIMLYNRPTWDALPSVQSVTLTGITPQECMHKGLPEREFAKRVHEELTQKDTISMGYNVINFDNEVNRNLFWRNGLPMYDHEYKQGCGVWDLFPMVVSIHALRGDVPWLRWPQWEHLDPQRFSQAQDRQGVCFKLEALTAANGLVHDKAHDALSDVRATIELARLIKTHEPRLWDWMLQNRGKKSVSEKIQASLDNHKPLLVSSLYLPQRMGYVLPLGEIKNNQVSVWDLNVSAEFVLQESAEQLAKRMRKETREAEGLAALPTFKIKVNASPFVCDNLKVLNAQRRAQLGLDDDRIVANLNFLVQNRQAIADKLQEAAALLPGFVDDYAELKAHAKTLVKTQRAVTPELLAVMVQGDADLMMYEGFVQESTLQAWNDQFDAKVATDNVEFHGEFNPWVVGTYLNARLRYMAPSTLSLWERDVLGQRARAMLENIERYSEMLFECDEQFTQAGNDQASERIAALVEWVEALQEQIYNFDS